MAWEMPNNLRRTFTTSTSQQVIFKTKTNIIELTIIRLTVKQKLVIFACKG